MKTVKVYRRDGSEAGSVELPDEIFGIEPSMTALHQVIKAYLANQRQGNSSTLTRSEVDVSKSKPFRQKGTGRARAGSANSPVWVGGGVTFGPKPRSYRQKINQKVKRLSLKSAYSIKAAGDKIKVVEDFTLEQPKTKEVFSMLKALGIAQEKIMFLVKDNDKIVYKSSRNIPKLSIENVTNANTYEIMNSGVVLFTKSAVEKITEVLKA